MSTHSEVTPTRDEIIALVGQLMYSANILNNTHRGNVVEAMVLAALGPEWKLVGLGWHPWDLERCRGSNRVRIQVKQCAALQLWTPRKPSKPKLNLGWKAKLPGYFFRDNPGEKEKIKESEGWFCDVFVYGLHGECDRNRADQVDPSQWNFLVIPTCDLTHGQDSLPLEEAKDRWTPVPWPKLSESVDIAIKKWASSSQSAAL